MKDVIYSNAQSGNFHISIEGLESVQFKLYDFQHPMISAGSTRVGNTSDRQNIMPGTHIDYDQLQVNFFVDEFWENYVECALWLRDCLNSEPYTKTKNITVMPLDNNKEPFGLAFTFTDAFPINVAPIPLDKGSTTDILVGMTLEFEEMLIDRNWLGK